MVNSRPMKFRAWTMGVMLESGKDFTTVPVNGQPLATKDGGMAINFDLMQYTGLKDKNGVEIYEGDIIEGGLIGYGSLGTMGVIEYDQEQSSYANKNEAGLTLLCEIDGFEVIGNIYQNKELLED